MDDLIADQLFCAKGSNQRLSKSLSVNCPKFFGNRTIIRLSLKIEGPILP